MNIRRGSSYFGLVFLMTFVMELLQMPTTINAEYPGVIELVGYSNRRARTHFMPPAYSIASARQLEIDSTPAPTSSKMRADIETVKQNIEKYNKLLTLDTKNLPESQKDMLERIVERVARLKETLDIEENQTQRKKLINETKSTIKDETTTAYTQTTAPSTIMETETDPTLVLDETTLLHLQTSMDELAAAQAAVTAQTTRMQDVPTTTELNLDTETANDSSNNDDTSNELNTLGSTSIEFATTTIDPQQTDATDPDKQFVVARANNNNIAAITAADADADPISTHSTTNAINQQRTLTTTSKLGKTRATKRPNSGSGATKTASSTSKRGQRPNQVNNNNNHHQSTAGLYKQTTTKQKLAAAAAAASAAATTAQPLLYNVSTKQKQQLLKQQQQQQQQLYQQKISLADKAAVTPAAPGQEQRTSPSSIAAYGASSTNSYNDMVYDEHVNTSSIIDSLNNAREEFYQQKHTVNINNKDKKPSSATAKPTKYHYYPHNQHIYLLPECAIQQVCNAVYVRLNYTQPLCACPSRYRDPCSASLNEDDQHTTKLVGDGKKKAITLAKTCEATTEMRECRSPKDWSLLALQNTRTGKSHYLVICRCPDHFKMEGPMAHDQPTYASVPGIRVFGMMCVKPGYSVRKPSVQPPKRYQLQKPFYRPNTQSTFVNNNQYTNGGGNSNSQNNGLNKDNYGRPIYGGGSSASAFSSGSNNNNIANNNYHSSQQQQQDVGGYQQQSSISQQQPSYQYLNRPESIHSSSSNSYRPDSLTSINNFPGAGSIYGRNNERQGETPIEAQSPSAAVTGQIDEDGKILISTSTQPTEEARTTLLASSSSSSEITSNKSIESENNALLETQTEENKLRKKRSIIEEKNIETKENDIDMPEFPWDRVLEFQKTINWD